MPLLNEAYPDHSLLKLPISYILLIFFHSNYCILTEYNLLSYYVYGLIPSIFKQYPWGQGILTWFTPDFPGSR